MTLQNTPKTSIAISFIEIFNKIEAVKKNIILHFNDENLIKYKYLYQYDNNMN